MPASRITETDGGRDVDIEAFELAVKDLAREQGAAPSPRQRDVMVETIKDLIAAGTTTIRTLARHAVAQAIKHDL
jgi:hypothetical protein